MSITRGTGNLLTQDVDALVNTVNTQGIMGKGIAALIYQQRSSQRDRKLAAPSALASEPNDRT